ncbi:MAG: hypothetical protein IJ774_05800 [Selenomonadaceae bacterium]|nr:hypothetical protein [Selenomonadaceae bacterium]MBR1805889.1 hypothetical protein [Selenomonadaceae bacterium]
MAKCIACGQEFKPLSSRQKTCSLQCTHDVAKCGQRGGFTKNQSPPAEKICPICKQKFTPATNHPYQKYCSATCRERAPIERAKLKTWFAVEWEAWKRDFAAGKTQSNRSD